jgi:hypothetical protein
VARDGDGLVASRKRQMDVVGTALLHRRELSSQNHKNYQKKRLPEKTIAKKLQKKSE